MRVYTDIEYDIDHVGNDLFFLFIFYFYTFTMKDIPSGCNYDKKTHENHLHFLKKQ